MENSIRKTEHKKVEEVELILSQLSKMITDDQSIPVEEKYPVIFVVGCARSGTTLVTQYLSQFDAFCYPTNFLSRFYYAPYTGSLLQRLMFDLDAKNELFGFIKGKTNFVSELGKTTGPLAPSEFWYYWRRFFKFNETQKLSQEQLAEVDSDSFIKGLRSIQSVFKKPLFLKGMIMNWHIPYLASIINNSYFIVVKRKLPYNAQSLYLSRERYFGDVNKWYSFKPVEFAQLKDLDALEQVVAQVHYTNKAIDEGIKELSAARVIEIQYETFCASPMKLIDEIKSKWKIQAETREVFFDPANKSVVDAGKWKSLVDLAERYTGR